MLTPVLVLVAGRSWFPWLPRSAGEYVHADCQINSVLMVSGGRPTGTGSVSELSVCVCCVQGENGLQGPKGYPGQKGNRGRGVSVSSLQFYFSLGVCASALTSVCVLTRSGKLGPAGRIGLVWRARIPRTQGDYPHYRPP